MIVQKTLDIDKETSMAYHKFKQAIKRPTTLRAYNHAVDRFMILCNFQNYDDAVKLTTETVHGLLENYVISLKNLSFQTANQRLAGIELFFDMNRVLYYKKILRKLLPNNDAESGGKLPYTTNEIFQMLSVTTKLRSKAIIHFFASTGCRPAAIEDPILRLKHIEDMPHNCKSILVYDGSKQGYCAFLTPEATLSLNNYLKQRKRNGENLTPESPVFVNVVNFPTTIQDNLSANSTRQMVRDILNKAGIERIKNGKRFDKAELYGFRKRFNTILKLNNDVNSNIAEKLMAHKRGLDGAYLQPTREECFAEFLKAVPELTIDPTEKQKLEIHNLQAQKSELEKKNAELMEMQLDIAKIKHRMNISEKYKKV